MAHSIPKGNLRLYCSRLQDESGRRSLVSWQRVFGDAMRGQGEPITVNREQTERTTLNVGKHA